MSEWIQYWLTPMLADERFNNNRTIILLTFDETETYSINNRVWTLALGGGLPAELRNTTDDTFYTHYSCLSTVEANWGLDSLGRGDTNQTLNNVFSFVANATNWKNNGITANSSAIPLLNLTGTIPGPLNPEMYLPFTAPNTSAVSPGGGSVFLGPGINTSFSVASLPAPVNLTALGEQLPWATNPGYDYPNGTQSYSSTTSGASKAAVPGFAALALLVGLVIAA